MADSALRHGAIDLGQLRVAAAALHGPGATRARRVAAYADHRADNPIESALRAIALDVPRLAVEPQREIDLGPFRVHPDLVDPRLCLVIEAEGWLAHGSTPRRFAKDLERHTRLSLAGWLVLRFGRDHIVDDPDWVRAALVEAVELRCGSRVQPAMGCPTVDRIAP